jgi:hypothetical protein
MSRNTTLTAVTLFGALVLLGTVRWAGAATPLKLRWIPRGTETAISGIPYNPDHSVHVRIKASMSYDPEDRYYAIRGIRTAGMNYSISVVPAFLHPNADRGIQAEWFVHSETSNLKSAELPEGCFLTSVQICDDDKGTSFEVRGVRVWGHKLDESGRPISPTGPVEFTRTGCKKWRDKVSCPSGTIAQSLRAYSSNAISLVCSKVEPAEGPWNPWSGRALDGHFKDGTGMIHMKVQMKNGSHTTGVVELADVKLMSGGQTVCQAKTSSASAPIPAGSTKDVEFAIPCDWARIKQAGGCKLGDTCAVKLSGTIQARVDGLLETHTYGNDATLSHVP